MSSSDRPARPHPFMTPGGPATSPAPRRREFLRGLALGAVAAGSVGLVGCGGGGSEDDSSDDTTFAHGVASGDPLADRVVLWTRVSGTALEAVEVGWQVAADAAFGTIVASGTATTGPATDFTVKVDAAGLQPGLSYWYRFRAAGVDSPVGRTRTLPAAGVQQVRLAVFSCASYPSGFFNAYAHAALREDLDAIVHLGDYLYEAERGGYGSINAVALGREVEPEGETVTLADYRTRYAQYRRDRDLQALHAAHPVIAVWDDHEVADDAWRDGAANHQANTEGAFAARKAAAIQAYHEWLPTRVEAPERLWRGFDFGNLVSLHMLDTRLAGRDEQLDYGDYLGDLGLDGPAFTAAVDDPQRQLLGAEQTAWLQQRLAASTATWQVLGQQVLMARMSIPAPILFDVLAPGTGTSFSAYALLAANARLDPASLTPDEQAILAQASIPYNLDAWDGYGAARETVLEAARSRDHNLVVLAGDTHNAWASDLLDAQARRGGRRIRHAVGDLAGAGVLPAGRAAGHGRSLDDRVHRAAPIRRDLAARLHGAHRHASAMPGRLDLPRHHRGPQHGGERRAVAANPARGHGTPHRRGLTGCCRGRAALPQPDLIQHKASGPARPYGARHRPFGVPACASSSSIPTITPAVPRSRATGRPPGWPT